MHRDNPSRARYPKPSVVRDFGIASYLVVPFREVTRLTSRVATARHAHPKRH